MQIKETVKDGVAVITLSGKMMGGPDTQELQDHLKGLLNDGIEKVVIDLGKVSFMNSSGLGALMACYTTLKNSNGQLKLANVAEKVQSLFMITQLMKIFDTYETVDRAIANFD